MGMMSVLVTVRSSELLQQARKDAIYKVDSIEDIIVPSWLCDSLAPLVDMHSVTASV